MNFKPFSHGPGSGSHLLLFFILTFVLTVVRLASAEETTKPLAAGCTLEIAFDREIGPATLDYLDRALVRVHESGCSSLLIRINTPGGNLQSTRLIVEEILASSIPILCYVGPSGGHAGSAGAIILEACHLTGAAPATNIGAASPVSSQGGQISEDMRKKIFNDTRSLVEGLATLRKRNLQFAKDIVDQASALSSEEALKLGAIDIVTPNLTEFLKFCDGKTVAGPDHSTLLVRVGPVVEFAADFRLMVLDFVTEPQFAYLMFMASLGLIYFEITHPGVVAPGVAGALGLILSFVAFHKLNVWWGGVALIVLGVVLLVLELFVNAFGALGIGGLIAFFLGSLFLFDPRHSGVSLSLSLILPTVLVLGAAMLSLAWIALRTMKLKPQLGAHLLIGKTGVIARLNTVLDESALRPSASSGQVLIQGEMWNFTSAENVALQQVVQVAAVHGLSVVVQAMKDAPGGGLPVAQN